MDHFIRITRTPYEEPHHLQLLLEVSNGRQTASLDFYVTTQMLLEAAKALEVFPRHGRDEYLFELGSEQAEVRFGFYLRMRAFLTNGSGSSALQFRINNNEDVPSREMAEFCIESEVQSINDLGSLLRNFAKREHTSLFWSAGECTLA